MLLTLFLVGLTTSLAHVQADATTKKLEAETDAVVDKIANAVAQAAMQPGEITPERLGAAATQTLGQVKGEMKGLKTLDPKSAKVPDMIANKLAARLEVMQMMTMATGKMKVSTGQVKQAVKQKVKQYQDAN